MKKSEESAASAPLPSSLLQSVLSDMGSGTVLSRMSAKLEELVETCRLRRASGKLIITVAVDVELDEMGKVCEVVFEASEAVKEPKEVFRPQRSAWYVANDGELTKEDPSRQGEFAIIREHVERENARPVSPSAPVVKMAKTAAQT